MTRPAPFRRPIGTVICDLDGVVWLADRLLPGAAEAIAALRASGRRVLFVSNNSSVVVTEMAAKLAGLGIPADGDLVTSAMAGAGLVQAGERVISCAGPGAEAEVLARGGVLVDEGPADVVVVGFHRTFNYDRLRRAAVAVRGGARLVATNDDATYPTPDGPIPGGGAILAAVEKGSGVSAIVAGKPYEPMVTLVRGLLGPSITDAVMIGDRPDTDGLFASALGVPFALVLSGVTGPDDLPVEPVPELIADDLAALVAELLATD
jgi:4-nitrophenyl phosphatase